MVDSSTAHADAEFERFLFSLLDLNLAPPSVDVEVAAVGRRVRTEFGDFAGHTQYVPGDDLRFLDWNALARTGHRVLRRFDRIEHERLELILDASLSMRERMPGVRRLAMLFVFLALHGLDSVQLDVLGEETRASDLEGAEAWPTAASALREIRVSGLDGIASVPRLLAMRPRGLGRVLISDFQPESRCVETLRECAREGQRLVCVFPRLPIEAGRLRAARGARMLRDPETGRQVEVTLNAALLDAFLDEQRSWESRMTRFCREHGHDFTTADLPEASERYRVASWLPFLTARRGRR